MKYKMYYFTLDLLD